jgi:hypothetical protein
MPADERALEISANRLRSQAGIKTAKHLSTNQKTAQASGEAADYAAVSQD